MLGRAAEAVPYLRAAVARQPEEPVNYLALSEALVGLGELAEARRHLERAATLVGKEAPEVVRIGKALSAKSKKGQAKGKPAGGSS
jgi:Flp pilus assembly protein TadD